LNTGLHACGVAVLPTAPFQALILWLLLRSLNSVRLSLILRNLMSCGGSPYILHPLQPSKWQVSENSCISVVAKLNIDMGD
jgi:hypothetical protein